MIIGNNNNENKFKDNNFLDNDTFNNQFNVSTSFSIII